MYYIFSHSLILLLLEFIETKNLKTYQYAYRNSGLDNIYKTIYQLWDVWQCSRSCCLKSCIEHIDCRSFAFNSNSGLCQIFNRDFRGQPLTGTVLHGILHYDTTSVGCSSGGPLNNSPASDCSDIQAMGYLCSGLYSITTSGITVQIWCDLQTDGGRWTVFQRRKDGTVNFNVDWNQYKYGFGNPSTNYWIGNDILHSLTMSGTNELLVLLETWSGVWKHARYANFRVNGESDKYRLTISGYNGTAGDSLAYSNGMQFSTKDQDNDAWPMGCNPIYHTGGWWFNGCTDSDLNGLYYDLPIQNATNSCHWNLATNNTRESLRTVFMMVRKP